MTAGGRRVAGWRSGDCCEDIKKARTSCRGKPGETATQNCLETRRDMGRGLREVGKGFHTQEESFLVAGKPVDNRRVAFRKYPWVDGRRKPRASKGFRDSISPPARASVRCEMRVWPDESAARVRVRTYAFGSTDPVPEIMSVSRIG